MSGDPWAYVEQAKANLQRTIDASLEQAAQTEAMNQELQATRIEKWSARREVWIALGPEGFIEDLEFSRSAPHSSPHGLALAFKQAHDGALRELYRRTDELADKYLSDQTGVRDWIKASNQEALGKFADPDPPAEE